MHIDFFDLIARPRRPSGPLNMERGAAVGLVRVRPAEEHLLGPQGRGRPWFLTNRPGPFPM
jgi:hypothetical protein